MAPRARERQISDLIRRCYAGLDATELRREVLRRLRRIVPVDAAFFATVDPATLLFTSVVSEDPLIDAAPRFLTNELEGRDVNRFVEVATDPVPIRWLDRATEGRRFDSARYAEIMRPLGLGDELRLALRCRSRCWGVMCLHRADGPGGFDKHDADILARLAPHIAEGLRRATLLPSVPTTGQGAQHGVVIVDDQLRIASMNDAAERWLAELPGTDWLRGLELPVPIASVVTAATADRATAPAPSIRMRTATGRWLAVHASELHGAPGGGTQTVVVLESATPADVSSLVLDAHGVTGAQAKVIAAVLRGRSTRQISAELKISPHTVQEHLKAVFDKLGVSTRLELTATLLTNS